MATLKDIALRTGLSMNTVSRALRQSGYVSRETSEKVSLAAKELNYRPNRAARELRSSCSRSIAVVAESGDYLHIQKITAIQQLAASSNFTTNNFFVSDEFERSRLEAICDFLLYDNPAGVILIGMDQQFIGTARKLASHFPVVLVSYEAIDDLDCVYIDRRGGVYDVVTHLYRAGCRRIAYLGSDMMGNKHKGYRDAVRELGLPEIWLPAEEITTSSQIRSDVKLLAQRIAAMSERPDGIQCSDYYAAALAAELPAHGIRVPEDLALVGFDNRDFVEVISPPLSTVAQPSREVGTAAAQLLISRINEGKTSPVRQLKIPMQLVIRESSKFGKQE